MIKYFYSWPEHGRKIHILRFPVKKIVLPENVSFILDTLRSAGYEAYAVGGCVRDSILGGTPDDWDITTSALPLQVKELFAKTVDTGIKHGTVTVILHGTGYEVTTYRIDGEYHDGRHPDSVSFTASLEEDLKRRDFTINAFVFNEEEGVIDLFDGLSDLKNGIIRCVGNPKARFTEDALRILRALRFAARFSFSIDPDTLEAAREIGPNLKKVSAERIRTELDKLLMSDNPDYIGLLHGLELDTIVLPQMCSMSEAEIEALKTTLKDAPKNRFIRWAVLCHYLTEHASDSQFTADTSTVSEHEAGIFREGCAKAILQNLKFDNKTIDTVSLFIRYTDRQLPVPYDTQASEQPSGISAEVNSAEYEEFRYKVRLLIHDISWEQINTYLDYRNSFSPEADFTVLYDTCRLIRENRECTCIRELDINGRILIEAGFAPGTGLGDLLDSLLAAAIKKPTVNTREQLLKMAFQIKDRK